MTGLLRQVRQRDMLRQLRLLSPQMQGVYLFHSARALNTRALAEPRGPISMQSEFVQQALLTTFEKTPKHSGFAKVRKFKRPGLARKRRFGNFGPRILNALQAPSKCCRVPPPVSCPRALNQTLNQKKPRHDFQHIKKVLRGWHGAARASAALGYKCFALPGSIKRLDLEL